MARKSLPDYSEIALALDQMDTIARDLQRVAEVHCFDLAELRGYHYHSGIVFAAYARGRPNAIALGGRYDEVGKAFGRARPATGFTTDLRELARWLLRRPPAAAILAPYRPDDAALRAKIEGLRGKGQIVIIDLPGHEDTRAGVELRPAARQPRRHLADRRRQLRAGAPRAPQYGTRQAWHAT